MADFRTRFIGNQRSKVDFQPIRFKGLAHAQLNILPTVPDLGVALIYLDGAYLAVDLPGLVRLRDELSKLIIEIEPKADYPITADPRD